MLNASVIAIPAAVQPLVGSLLAGPQAFQAALQEDGGVLGNNDNYAAVEAATRIFSHGISDEIIEGSGKIRGAQERLVDAKVRALDDRFSAARFFGEAVREVGSGRYALGRADLRAALSTHREPWRLRPEAALLARRDYFPVAILDSHQIRRGIGSEGGMRRKESSMFRPGDVADGGQLYQEWGIETANKSPLEIWDQLARIWSSAEADDNKRYFALRLGYEQIRALMWDQCFTGVSERLESLIDVYLEEKNWRIMKCITEMLGLLLRAKDFDEALRLLPKIAELIRGGKKLEPLEDDYVVGPPIFDEAAQQEEQKLELLCLYGGILAVHGVRTTEQVGVARVVEGALALLDIAADSNLSSLIRRTAFQYGLYAVEKFVPELFHPNDGRPTLGARVVHDWVLWQVEAERYPDHASRLAEDYALVASPRDATDPIQISEQQWRAVLRASRRSDLDPDLRRDLWRSLSYGQNWKRRLLFGLLQMV